MCSFKKLTYLCFVLGLLLNTTASSSNLNQGSPSNLTDHIIGDTSTVGTSWDDLQHHSSVGRMVALDSTDYLHFVWMNTLYSGSNDRNVYYNFKDPHGVQGWPGCGYPIEDAYRAGYVNLDVGYGNVAFPVFHMQNCPGYPVNTALAVDFFPHCGAFLWYTPEMTYFHDDWLNPLWPNMVIGRNGLLHIIASVVAGNEHRCVYTAAEYEPSIWLINFQPPPDIWEYFGSTAGHRADIAASDVSDRIAIAWVNLHRDIKVLIDEDGFDLDFDEAFNLTQFIPPDAAYLPDTTLANRDTLRAWGDLSMFFDDEDFLHVAFTTQPYFHFGGPQHWNSSIIWHWTEAYPHEFSTVAVAWDVNDEVICPGSGRKAQRPALCQDETNGYTYCIYQQYDTDSTRLNWAGYPSGDMWVTVSTDGGLNWAEATNFAETETAGGAPAGQSYSEECPSLADRSDGNLHAMYTLDRDAGYCGLMEGAITLNQMISHDVPVEDIPSTPLIQSLPFHVDPVPTDHDDPGMVQLEEAVVRVFEANPNPFNPETTLSFDIENAAPVKFKVYDIHGRLVETIADGWHKAGFHEYQFKGSALASGVYFYVLQVGHIQHSGKMVLLK